MEQPHSQPVLKEKLLLIGQKAEEAIANATQSLVERRPLLAREVVEAAREIEPLEMDIDNICLSLLTSARQSANDFRFVTLALKIVRDVGRIGNCGANIARRCLEAGREPELKPLIDIAIAARAVQFTLKQSLDAFVNGKREIAKCVMQGDGYIEDVCRQVFQELVINMLQDSSTIPRALQLIFVSRNLERAGDHATHIARTALFLHGSSDLTITGGGQCENATGNFRIGAAC